MRWLLAVLLMLTVAAEDYAYKIYYGYSTKDVAIYWVHNNTNYYLFCEIEGDRGYYNAFEISPNRNSRPYTDPNENLELYCQ